ncbi:MAG: hypothetical protein SF028_00965 [Candidatus Sumerlaeia bacterium]|nr:hypothetical protein [Candidatus Sumerlaeia bacterium]
MPPSERPSPAPDPKTDTPPPATGAWDVRAVRSTTIYVGLDAWMIRWQLFGDISKGSNLVSSIEFALHSIRESDAVSPSMDRIGNCFYRLRGIITRRTRAGWLLDGPVPMHCSEPLPRGIGLGSAVEVDASLWFDRTGGAPPGEPLAVPARWRVARIYRDTATWNAIRSSENQPIREGGWLPKVDNPANIIRATENYDEVAKTNSKGDDHGSAHYLVALEFLGACG